MQRNELAPLIPGSSALVEPFSCRSRWITSRHVCGFMIIFIAVSVSTCSSVQHKIVQVSLLQNTVTILQHISASAFPVSTS